MKNFIETDEELTEGAISSSFSTATALVIIKKLLTPWKNWDAFKLGLIDSKGKRTDKPVESREDKESLNIFNSFIIGLRRLLLTFMSEGILKILVAVYVTKNLIKR